MVDARYLMIIISSYLHIHALSYIYVSIGVFVSIFLSKTLIFRSKALTKIKKMIFRSKASFHYGLCGDLFNMNFFFICVCFSLSLLYLNIFLNFLMGSIEFRRVCIYSIIGLLSIVVSSITIPYFMLSWYSTICSSSNWHSKFQY